MTEETLARTLDSMENRVVLLHHFGEPLLHKSLEALVGLCARRGFTVGISTNGKSLTQERLDSLAGAGLAWLRLHTDPFGVRLSKFSIPVGLEMTEHRILVMSDAPKKEIVSFSGYLDLPRRKDGPPRCSYLQDKWVVVLWDGSIALCCHDVEGTRSQDLCKNCDGYIFRDPRTIGHYDGEPSESDTLPSGGFP